jgi:hypothetical protein
MQLKPPLCVSETKVSVPGSVSVSTTPAAAVGPMFWTVIE